MSYKVRKASKFLLRMLALTCSSNTCVVHTGYISRGQNPNIVTELEKMISKHYSVKIVQADYRTCDMSK